MSLGNEAALIGYTNNDARGFYFDYNNAHNNSYYHSTDPSTTGEVASNNTWYHVAFVRDGADLRVYLDGVLKNTNPIGSTSLNAPSGNMTIGGPPFSGGLSGYIGYIDDFRISKGLARYTEAFNVEDVITAVDKTANAHVLTAVGNAGMLQHRKNLVITLYILMVREIGSAFQMTLILILVLRILLSNSG